MTDKDPCRPDLDRRLMDAAIRLGKRELGRAWPNPAVGTLIVRWAGDDPVIVGRGWTRMGGRPHAETEALAEAGEAARGATAYISLEPCAHHGRTPPCVDGLIAAGVGRVVSAVEDPDPRVSGRGYARLREAGIEVAEGVCVDAAREANRGHFMRRQHGRPWITVKLAVSRDGYIAGPGNRPVAITERQAQARSHMMRATNDAILVGVGTVLSDDPQLTCRLPGMAERSPVRVVLDSKLRMPAAARMLSDTETAPVWIISGPDAPAGRKAELEEAGGRVLHVPLSPDGRTDIAEVARSLAEGGLTRVLVEGGARVAGAFAEAGLADELVIFETEGEIGEGGVPAMPGAGLAALLEGGAYSRLDTVELGPDRMSIWLRI